ncbi:MAG TPA: hypothetical protein DDY91_24075 [Planctomycetaceae bacterium]|nr:hypothetical protein [Planctomycetaceae bacterium]
MAKTHKNKVGTDLSHIVEALRPLAVPIGDIVPDSSNARTHGRANLDAIKGSLRQFGQAQPLLVQGDSMLLRAGHGRLAAARELLAEGDKRWEQIAVLKIEWDNATGTAFAIADNRTAELADWDPAALEKQLRDVAVGDPELQQMFTDLAEQLELIVAEEVGEEQPAIEVPERYQVVITCTDETHQKLLLEDLENRGIECRAIVS